MKLATSIFALLVLLYACVSKKPSQSHASPAVVVAPFVEKSTWNYEGNDGIQFLTPNWNIRTTVQVPHIVDALPDFYNDLLEHYTTIFGELPYPKEQIDVFLFANETQWKRKLVEMLGPEANQWNSLGRGGLTVDGTALLYHLDTRGRSRVTLRIAAHEGWHQYAEVVFKDCLPTWLDEGIGTWMEGFRIRNGETKFMPASNWDRLTTLRRIVTAHRLDPIGSLITFEPSALLATGRTTLLGYYAQLWALTSFIVEYEDGKYKRALEEILRSALDGTLREPDGGWMFAFTENPLEMEHEYKEWVEEYTRPGTTWR